MSADRQEEPIVLVKRIVGEDEDCPYCGGEGTVPACAVCGGLGCEFCPRVGTHAAPVACDVCGGSGRRRTGDKQGS